MSYPYQCVCKVSRAYNKDGASFRFFPSYTPSPLTRPSSPRWEACHWIFRSLRSPTNPVPLPPKGDAGGALHAYLFLHHKAPSAQSRAGLLCFAGCCVSVTIRRRTSRILRKCCSGLLRGRGGSGIWDIPRCYLQVSLLLC
jgi:hypothetical protein